MKLTPFIQPEISLRIVSLILSIIALLFVYLLFFKTVNNKVIPFLTVVITSFTPIFLQRSQIVNLDVLLLVGWLGYMLFFENFLLSLIFLTVAVLTKSLLGFYPVFIIFVYYLFLFARKKIGRKELKKIILKISIHIGILALWYVSMFITFGENFWQQHIVETHFRRVTSSLESHFGQRTYYIDLISQELGWLIWPALIGLIITISNVFIPILRWFATRRVAKAVLDGSILSKFICERYKNLVKRKSTEQSLFATYLIPWFIFLNLTKTKIFWYLYPAIPQFAFLSVLPLSLLERKRIIYYIVGFVIVGSIFYTNFVKTNFFSTFYSQPEDHYRLSLYAKDRCESLTVLVGKETRDSIKTLEGLGLTITSTKQWGDHPSIVYYFGKKVSFSFDKENFYKNIPSIPKGHCFSINKSDLIIDDPRLRMPFFIGLFGDLSLLKKMY